MKLILISYPKNLKNETDLVTALFKEGLEYFHLRKPGFSKRRIEIYISKIPEKFRNRIIIYDYFELVDEYNLKGVHFNRKTKHLVDDYYNYDYHKSFSAHSFEEIKNSNYKFDYFFISPVFDSISKNDYKSVFSPSEIRNFIYEDVKNEIIVALGGINDNNIEELKTTGLGGVAILGFIWKDFLKYNDIEKTVSLYKNLVSKISVDRPKVLSIAGFDPVSGAGITADIKTFENNSIYGLGACTSITYQNENEFFEQSVIEFDKLKKQLEPVFSAHKIDYAKIGLIPDIQFLEKTVRFLKGYNKEIKIIWDPILKSGTGFLFHDKPEINLLQTILDEIYLLTPNTEEAKLLFGEDYENKIPNIVKKTNCNILLKGGHERTTSFVNDKLFTASGKEIFKGEKFNNVAKHGTGCVLSSAITANMAKGESLSTSCRKGKEYVEKFIKSNNLKLGYHK